MNRLCRLMPTYSRRVRLVLSSSALAATAASTGSAQTPPTPIRALGHTRFVLPNGLVAILSEDHTTPIVSVDVWYHIGSKDDKPDRPGMAHLCEHIMSQGSPHLNQPQPAFYRSIGGTSTHYAETTEDATEYYITVPSNELETVLWAESDRMAAPLSTADSPRLAAVGGVVAQERRQTVDNIPFGAYRELTIGALYPAGHPYHLTPLSQTVDPAATSLAALRDACLSYYAPNNAVLTLSGDFATPAARVLIEKYFGGIPRGKPVVHPDTRVAPLAAEERLVLEDARATQSQLHFDWRGASYAGGDRMAVLALASALSLPRFGRLSKLLVYDRQLATNVIVDNYDLEQAGVFEIVVVPRPGASMTLIELLVDSTLASLASSPVTRDEIARFNAFTRVNAATSLQLQFARADAFAHDETFAGDPAASAKQVNAALGLTPAEVQQAARKYLTRGRVVMSLVPAGKLDLVSRPNLPFMNVTPPSATAAPRVLP
jgi:zinc protease